MTASAAPAPCDLGAPKRFTTWRPEQLDAWHRYLDTDRRFVCFGKPTGSGKSLLAYMCGLYTDSPPDRKPRTLILTATKALQDQYIDTLNVRDVRGQNNHECVAVRPGGLLSAYGERKRVMCDVAPCHAGVPCKLRHIGGCLYYDSVTVSRNSQFVVTNYSYWLALGKMVRRDKVDEPLGQFDLIVCDEAHAAADQVCRAVGTRLSKEQCYLTHTAPPHPGVAKLDDWVTWAKHALGAAADRMDQYREEMQSSPEVVDSQFVREMRELSSHIDVLNQIATLSGDWVIADGKTHVTFDSVWPGPATEELLFRGIPHVLLLSATIRPKTLDILNITESERLFHEYPSSFPKSRRPVYIIPSGRVDKRMTPGSYDERVWITRLDQIIEQRLDRKGIIHSVSYPRAVRIKQLSKYGHLMIVHTQDTKEQAVEQFRNAPAPRILCSPSVTTGEDFPGRQCEYIVQSKVPFLDTRDEISKRRDASDPGYSGYQMMQTLVQGTPGRGSRAAADQCEGFIIDDHARWVLSTGSKSSLRVHAPQYWLESVVWCTTIPEPPPRLAI